jgi:hypothetical protein
MADIEVDISDFGTLDHAKDKLQHLADRLRGDQDSLLRRLGRYQREVIKEVAPKSHRLGPRNSPLHGADLTEDRISGNEVRFFMPHYFKWVIWGRGPVQAKPKGMLHFWTERGEFFRKRVGPAKANDFRPRAVKEAEPALSAIFENWVSESLD